MKYHVRTLEGCTQLLEIKAEEKELQEIQERVYRDFEKVARVPGFRVGKAPRNLVMRHYEKETREELLKRFIPELYEKAIQETGLKPVGLPEISDVHFENLKFSFKAKIETEPEIPLQRYKGLKATQKQVVVTPQEVQNGLRAIREQRAELVPKEGVVEEDDFVLCDVEGRVDGKVTENRKNILIYTSLKEQKHPELVKALLGSRVGELRETDLILESPGGVVQKTHYQVRINEIKRKNLPEMNDEFAKGVSRFQTLKELEEAVSKEIQGQKERESQRVLEKDLLDQLKAACPFAVPRLMVEQEAKRLAEEERFHLKLLGWTDQAIETRMTRDKEGLQQEAETRVRNSLILEKVAEAEKIEVHPEEINEKIRSLGSRLGRNEKEKKEDLTNASIRRRMWGEVLFEKALSVVVGSAQIKEVP